MGMKRYLAPNMQQALRQIREELGSDAIILSTQKTAAGVEVTCSVDDPAPARLRPEQPRSSGQVAVTAGTADERVPTARSIVAEPLVRPADLVAQKQENELAMQVMRDEIQQLRSMIRELPGLVAVRPVQVAAGTNAVTSPAPDPASAVRKARSAAAPGKKFRQRMTSMGLSPELIQHLLGAAGGLEEEADWQRILGSLCADITVAAQELIDVAGVYVMLGASGAGKTTTVAKLAARYVMKYGRDALVLVTTDRYRLAGAQQLQTVGRLLKVPVIVPDTNETLDDVLDRLSDKKMVLVDSAGMVPSDAGWIEQTRLLATARHRVRRCLVMPATSQIQVLKASYNAFRVIGIDHCIISKMDEAMSLGEVLSMVVTEKLSLAYITDGQRIAADIHRCSARSLVTRLLKMWQDNQTDKHFTGDKAQYGQDLVI
jgi:flagellar biosynthesis protein FlhF